jgi:Cu2+-exporting ATPase
MAGRSMPAVSARLGSARFCGADLPATNALHACLSDDQGWLATFVLQEDLRPDAHATVAALTAQGIQVHLLSGDLPESVARVARQAGIDDARGACTPQDKLAFLRGLQLQGRKVAMVGDGLNDGPVLAGAHVSFAFGQAVPLAQAQSDFVVLGARLGTVAQTLLLARRTLGIVRQNLWWAAVYNAVCVPLAVVGWLPAWLAGLGMALSSLLVVLNALRLSTAMAPLEKL